MLAKDFDDMVEQRTKKIKEILSSKAKEYAVAEDRLHNFKRAAIVGEVTAAVALKGMLLKHLISVFDMIDKYDQEAGIQFSLDLIDEKIGDLINYSILLEALFKEPHTQK
jgi:hypothetical protein